MSAFCVQYTRFALPSSASSDPLPPPVFVEMVSATGVSVTCAAASHFQCAQQRCFPILLGSKWLCQMQIAIVAAAAAAGG